MDASKLGNKGRDAFFWEGMEEWGTDEVQGTTFTELQYWDGKKQKAQERKDKIVSEDIALIDKALKTGNEKEIRLVHKKIDIKYRDIIKYLGKGMNEYSQEYGFNYNDLKLGSMTENLHLLRSKLEAFKEGWTELNAKDDSMINIINAVKEKYYDDVD
ncbi:MAG: hypothetical protein IK081_11215 [Lachnospiraceae bacterium]|nr:hypothetical protein [Lachnospiraceae bacterium]